MEAKQIVVVETVTDEQLRDAVLGLESNVSVAKQLRENNGAFVKVIGARVRAVLRDDAGAVRDQQTLLQMCFIPATVGRLKDMQSLVREHGATWQEAYNGSSEQGSTAVSKNRTAAYGQVIMIRKRANDEDAKELAELQAAQNPQAVADVQELAGLNARLVELQKDKDAVTKYSLQQDEKVRDLSATVGELRKDVDTRQELANTYKVRAENAEEQLTSAKARIVELETQVAELQAALAVAEAKASQKKQAKA